MRTMLFIFFHFIGNICCKLWQQFYSTQLSLRLAFYWKTIVFCLLLNWIFIGPNHSYFLNRWHAYTNTEINYFVITAYSLDIVYIMRYFILLWDNCKYDWTLKRDRLEITNCTTFYFLYFRNEINQWPTLTSFYTMQSSI